MATNKFHVLSLDGGGTWSTIQVAALSKLYTPDTRGHEILKDFHCVAANSGGSIVLAGLLLNASLRELQQLFGTLEVRQSLFTPLSPFDGGLIYKWIRGKVGGPRFQTSKKREKLLAIFNQLALENHISSQYLDELAKGINDDFHFTIVGYDYRRDRAKYFRSNLTSAAGGRSGSLSQAVHLVDAIHASSTPPVKFFDLPAEGQDPTLKNELFWDGAITGQNNPIVAGVVEALATGAKRDEIVVLSLGTGNNAIPPDLIDNPPWKIDGHIGRLMADIGKLSQAVISDPPDHATFVAHMMLSSALPDSGSTTTFNNSPIVRLNPLIAPLPNTSTDPASWKWPAGLSTEEQRKIINLDMAAIESPDFARVQQLAIDWINGQIRNQPIRMSSNLVGDIGDDTFLLAWNRWKAIK